MHQDLKTVSRKQCVAINCRVL